MKGPTSTKLPARVRKAVDLLAAHHSNPKYKEDMNSYYWKGSGANQWGSWSPQMPKTQPRKKVKEEKGAKDNKKEGVVKPYDSTSMVGSASSDGQSTEMVFMKEFLSFMKESGTDVPERFQKFMPNDKMTEIRSQQKKLNKQRNGAQKIENKRKAIERDGEQWTLWLSKMREEIQAEKDKHVANQERLHKELDALLDEQRNLAKEDDEEMPEKSEEQEAEESLDALLQNGANPVPSTMGQPEINKYLMDMQSKMEEQFTKRLEEERQKMVFELSKYIPGKGKGGGKEVDVVERHHRKLWRYSEDRKHWTAWALLQEQSRGHLLESRGSDATMAARHMEGKKINRRRTRRRRTPRRT